MDQSEELPQQIAGFLQLQPSNPSWFISKFRAHGPNNEKVADMLLYSLKYLSKMTALPTTPAKFQRNSANCCFTILPLVDEHKKPRKIFIKAVPPDVGHFSSFLPDAINGILLSYIIRNYFPHKKYNQHIMKFNDNFPCYVSTALNGYSWDLVDLIEPTGPFIQGPRSVNGMRGNYIFYFTCFDCLENAAPIDTVMKSKPNDVIHAFADFYDFMLDMGSRFGMMHNDLHCGNIFYDANTKSLRMIDYGDMIFSVFIEEMFEELMQKPPRNPRLYSRDPIMEDVFESLKSTSLKHGYEFKGLYEFNQIFHSKKLTSSDYYSVETKSYMLVYFDLLTIAATVYFGLLNFRAKNPAENLRMPDPTFIKFLGVTGNELESRRNLEFEIVSHLPTLIKSYIAQMKAVHNPNHNCILDGLFLLALMVWLFAFDRNMIDPKSSTFRVPLKALSQNQWLYTYFQFYPQDNMGEKAFSIVEAVLILLKAAPDMHDDLLNVSPFWGTIINKTMLTKKGGMNSRDQKYASVSRSVTKSRRTSRTNVQYDPYQSLTDYIRISDQASVKNVTRSDGRRSKPKSSKKSEKK